ncbi:hypothetical protein NE237_018667 [Protea cynaroides]|uniref:Uncharacterized protein n=1 Tax=Protea cynaroides TaxID=273540 RepID=A0A9Q0KA95_9MAGN|nr:hypothetical protein NE237_018667 [Protea cynaroides]
MRPWIKGEAAAIVDALADPPRDEPPGEIPTSPRDPINFEEVGKTLNVEGSLKTEKFHEGPRAVKLTNCQSKTVADLLAKVEKEKRVEDEASKKLKTKNDSTLGTSKTVAALLAKAKALRSQLLEYQALEKVKKERNGYAIALEILEVGLTNEVRDLRDKLKAIEKDQDHYRVALFQSKDLVDGQHKSLQD